jgi:molybdate transport system regulatory protein
LRVELGEYGGLGPGKIGLLELIEAHGSIAAAGRAMRMSYRRAWLLVDALNQKFRKPLVARRHGGIGGGKAELTPLGRRIVQQYRTIEGTATRATARYLRTLARSLAGARRR